MHTKVSAFLSRRSNRSIVQEYQRQQRRPVDLSRELPSGDRQKAIRSRRCKKTNQQQTFRRKRKWRTYHCTLDLAMSTTILSGSPLKRAEVRRAVRAVIMLLSFDAAYLAAQPERRNHSQYFGEWGRPTCQTLRCSQHRKPEKGYFWSLARLI